MQSGSFHLPSDLYIENMKPHAVATQLKERETVPQKLYFLEDITNIL